jgi:hypothetical protein
LLKQFARWCALQVIHLWNVPPVVREYLETGNDSLREEAYGAAAGAAAGAAYWAADEAAAWAADEATARAAYWAATWAAYDTATYASLADNPTNKYRERFAEMVNEAFEKENI